MLLRPSSDTTRKWNDYSLISASYDGSKAVRSYIERFNTVSYFNEYAGILSYFFIIGQILAPYIRIPIHGAHLDCRLHVFWVQQSRTGKSIAYEFIAKVLKLLNVELEVFSAGSDARMIGTVEEKIVYDDKGKPTNEREYVVVPGLLNGYKTLLFDEASILLNDNKSYFSDKILYLQQSMAPIGSETNVLVKHLVGGSVRTPSGVSHWMTTFPPKDLMTHVLEKGFFQRVFFFQNDVGIETRQTTSEHRVSGAYVPVPDSVYSYEDIAKNMLLMVDDVRDRLFEAGGINQEGWDSMSEDDREAYAIRHAYDLFTVGPSYHAALLNAVDDYYGLIKDITNPHIKDTALSFMPNVENYTMIFASLIAATMRERVITADHVMMATEIVYDNLHNLVIWLEQKEDYRHKKKREVEAHAWKKSFNKVKKLKTKRDGLEVVRRVQIEEHYAKAQGVSPKTARRRMDKLLESGSATRHKDGRLAFIHLEW